MTQFDHIIEATRRGFLKQVAGTVAAAVTPTPASSAIPVAASSMGLKSAAPIVYDLAPAINNDSILGDAIETMWHETGKDFDGAKIRAMMKSIRDNLNAGKPIRNKALLKALMISNPATSDNIKRNFAQTLLQGGASDRTEFQEIDDWTEQIWDNMSSGLDTDYDLLTMYMPAGDITYNGKILYNQKELLRNRFFCPQADVTQYTAESIKDMQGSISSLDKVRKHVQDKETQDAIDNTHAGLGIRRDSAWYESVMNSH